MLPSIQQHSFCIPHRLLPLNTNKHDHFFENKTLLHIRFAFRLLHCNAYKSDHFQLVLRVNYRKTIVNFESLTSLWHGLYTTFKVHSHLYANANTACGTEANANKCQKVACSAFSTQANEEVFRWLFVGSPNGFGFSKNHRQLQSVCPYQYDWEHIFLWSTDS